MRLVLLVGLSVAAVGLLGFVPAASAQPCFGPACVPVPCDALNAQCVVRTCQSNLAACNPDLVCIQREPCLPK